MGHKLSILSHKLIIRYIEIIFFARIKIVKEVINLGAEILITVKDVEHTAKLARLELTDEEKEKYTRQFSDILGYFDQLKEVDTSDVEPMAHVMPIKNVMREDEIKQEHSRDDILRNAPLEEDGYFRVPKI